MRGKRPTFRRQKKIAQPIAHSVEGYPVVDCRRLEKQQGPRLPWENGRGPLTDEWPPAWTARAM